MSDAPAAHVVAVRTYAAVVGCAADKAIVVGAEAAAVFVLCSSAGEPELPAGFVLWFDSPRAEFFRRYARFDWLGCYFPAGHYFLRVDSVVFRVRQEQVGGPVRSSGPARALAAVPAGDLVLELAAVPVAGFARELAVVRLAALVVAAWFHRSQPVRGY